MMSHRKRLSVRRWKARAKLGREIPKWAIVAYRLNRWFKFTPRDNQTDFYLASPVTVAGK